jgi:hypothetical protein
LPGALSRSALGALNRLVSGAADIPATYLLGLKEQIEDRNYERRLLRRKLAEAAISVASHDKMLVNRTLDRLMNEQVRKQENREAIAREAVLLLENTGKEDVNPTDHQVAGEWLSSFEKFAEDATSEDLRNLWARVLVGEIKSPGSFSRQTLRFLHDLDSHAAVSFEKISKLTLGGRIYYDDESGEIFSHLLTLDALGVVSGVGGFVQMECSTDEQGRFTINGEQFSLVGLSDPNAKIAIEATPLTKMGLELIKIVPNTQEEQTVLELSEILRKPLPLSKASVRGAALAQIVDKNTCKYIRTLWGDNPFDL